jgi:tyrosine aminotransferase
MVINPSNPCGSAFTKEHQLEIIQLADQFKIPILADEVYYGITYSGQEFHSFGHLSKTVPMIVSHLILNAYLVS